MKKVVIARYDVKPGMVDELAREVKESGLQGLYEKQPGNLYFKFAIPLDEPNKFYLTDVWDNEESFQAHLHCDVAKLWAAIKAKYVIGSEAMKYDCTSDD